MEGNLVKAGDSKPGIQFYGPEWPLSSKTDMPS